MANGQLNSVLHHLNRLFGSGQTDADSDGELLRRFLEQRDQEAFAVLVQRHGPLVHGVCRQLVRDRHDAEDAFQAAFLVLARKAGSIRRGTSVAGWLYRVAFRIALKVRSRAARHEVPESQVAAMATARPIPDEIALQEMRPALHEEVNRLPARYRLPVLLCYLQSKTNDEAAAELGCPVGTVKGRLNRARNLLRTRLERRGLALAAALFVAEVPQALALEPVSASHGARTARAAFQFVWETTSGADAVSPAAVRLAEGVLNAMWVTKLKTIAFVAVAASFLTVGGGMFLYQALAAQGVASPTRGEYPPVPANAAPRPKDARDLAGDPLPPGALARLGTLRWRQESPFALAGFAPADGRLVTAGTNGIFRVWDFQNGKELRRFGDASHLNSGDAILAPNGQVLAELVAGPKVRLWDVQAGKEIRTFAISEGENKSSATITFSHDSRTLFAGNIADALVRQFEVGSGKEINRWTFQPPANNVSRLAASPDGKWLLMVSREHQGGLRPAPYWALLDLASGKESAHIQADDERCQGGFFSADSSSLILIGPKRALTVFELASGRKLHRLDMNSEGAASSPDGKVLATFGRDDATVRLWDMRTGKPVGTPTRLGESGETSALMPPAVLAFSPDGKALVAAVGGNALHALDVNAGTERHRAGHRGAVTALALTRDGKTVISRGADGTVRYWHAETGVERASYALPPESIGAKVVANDKVAYTAGDSVYVRGVTPDREVHRFPLPGNPPAAGTWRAHLAASDDGRRLAILAGTRFGLRDLSSGKELAAFDIPLPPPENVGSYRHDQLALSPDGALVAVATDWTARSAVMGRHVFAVWHTGSGTMIRQSRGNPVTACAFAPDGLTLATAYFKSVITIQELAGGRVRIQLPCTTDYVTALAMSRDGRTLVASTVDHSVVVWDTLTGKELARFRGHRAAIYVVAISPDGKRIYSGSDDTTILSWDGAAFPGRPQPSRLTEDAAEARFAELTAEDGPKVRQAILALTQDPTQAVATLGKHVVPVRNPPPGRLAELIADLNSNNFAVRQKANGELELLADLAEPQLRDALKKNPSVEARRRIETLLEQLGPGQSLPVPLLQRVRAVEVLGYIGSPDARTVLQSIAQGAPGARLTQQARMALALLRPE